MRTFVLVHGAWHGGWCWRHVETLLRRAGHRVFCPTQTGLGERRHLMSRNITLDVFVADVTNLIEFEELENVVLVGHSFGGSTVSGVADAMKDRLRQVIYVDALLIDGGSKPFDTLPDHVVEVRREAAHQSSGGLSLPVPTAQSFGVFDESDAAWLERRLTPHPLGVYESPLRISGPIGNGLPRFYVACTSPAYTPLQASRERAMTEPGWSFVEMKTGHDAMVTAPAELAALLQDLVV